jgi:hypothetical protein
MPLANSGRRTFHLPVSRLGDGLVFDIAVSEAAWDRPPPGTATPPTRPRPVPVATSSRGGSGGKKLEDFTIAGVTKASAAKRPTKRRQVGRGRK